MIINLPCQKSLLLMMMVTNLCKSCIVLHNLYTVFIYFLHNYITSCLTTFGTLNEFYLCISYTNFMKPTFIKANNANLLFSIFIKQKCNRILNVVIPKDDQGGITADVTFTMSSYRSSVDTAVCRGIGVTVLYSSHQPWGTL